MDSDNTFFVPGRVYPVVGNGLNGKFPPVLCIAANEEDGDVIFCAYCGCNGIEKYDMVIFDPTLPDTHLRGSVEYRPDGDVRAAFIAGGMMMVLPTDLGMNPCENPNNWYKGQWWD